MKTLRRNGPELLALMCLVGLTAVQLAACAGDKALVVSGETLVGLSETFAATAETMETALDTKAITPETYRRWRVFSEKFQQAYPLAADLWKVAADTKDERLQVQAGAAVAQLGADLGAWAALVGVH